MKVIVAVNLKEWALIPFKETSKMVSRDKLYGMNKTMIFFLCFCLIVIPKQKLLDAVEESNCIKAVE